MTVDYPAATGGVKTPAVPSESVENLFPEENLNAFLDGEDRYADIKLVAPKAAPHLRSALSRRTRLLHMLLSSLQ